MAELIHTLNKHTRDVNCCSFSADSKILASVSGDKTVCLWNVETGEELECSPFLAHTYRYDDFSLKADFDFTKKRLSMSFEVFKLFETSKNILY